MLNETMIRVWPFEDAPLQYQALSPHGGDEDWVAVVPAILARRYANPYSDETWIHWLQSGSPFGRCSITMHELPDGSQLFIGAHA